METLLRKIAKFIVENFSSIAEWIVKVIEDLVGKALPIYKTITSVSNYLRSLGTTSLEYIGKLLGV